MRTGAVTIIFGFLLLLVAFVLLTTTTVVAGLSARVTAQSGPVEVQRRGQDAFVPLTGGEAGPARVKVGDTLRTGPGAEVTLQYADGSRLRLAPSTTLVIRKYQYDSESLTQVSLFDLQLGRVWTRVSHALANDSRFEIGTADAVAGVRGTIFEVAVEPGRTVITVADGQVAVTDRAGGQEHPVVAGQAAVVGAGGFRQQAVPEAQLQPGEMVLPSVRFGRFLPGLVRDGRYTLRGTAERGAKMTIDGQPVTVDPDGTFEHSVAVAPGLNQYRVEVSDAAGHVRKLLHNLEYRPRQ